MMPEISKKPDKIEVTLFPGTKMRQMVFYDSDGGLKHMVTGGEEIEGMPVGSKWLRFSHERVAAGEMREALKLCKKALYDAVHRADVMNMPEYAADAIQQTQYILETIAAEEERNNGTH
jgi:hypothetical protein